MVPTGQFPLLLGQEHWSHIPSPAKPGGMVGEGQNGKAAVMTGPHRVEVNERPYTETV